MLQKHQTPYKKYRYQEVIDEQKKREEMAHNSSLTAEKVYGFTASCLVHRFDGAVEIPQFHEELWELCCSPYKKVAIAAPRNHAKSTSVTLSYLLATVLFRDRNYVIIVSDTEGQAVQFLSDIKTELEENDDIVSLFGVSSFIKDSATDLIVQMDDGYQFRIMAKGSEQKVRGLKWRNKRPDLIICHEEGTSIFADGKWIKNQEHPTAKRILTNGYRITFEDGTVEVISADHRYWIENLGWCFARDLEEGMEVGGCHLLMTREEQDIANIVEDGEKGIRKKLELNKLRIVNGIKKGYVRLVENGLKRIQKRIKNLRENTILKIRIKSILMLESMLVRIPAGRLHTALKEELSRNLQCLRGQIKSISNSFTKEPRLRQRELVVRLR